MLQIKSENNKTAAARKYIWTAIQHGDYKVGEKIPPEAELRQRLGISRNTIREAVASLVHGGVLERRQGSGTYVVTNQAGPGDSQFKKAPEKVQIGIVLPEGFYGSKPSPYLLGLMRGIHHSPSPETVIETRLLSSDISYQNLGGTYFKDAIQSQIVDAMILTSFELASTDVTELVRGEIPAIFLGIESPSKELPFVEYNLAGGVQTLIAHLFETGRRKISFLLDHFRGRTTSAFLSGAVGAWTRLGCHPDITRTAFMERDFSRIPAAVEQLLAREPDAIVCCDDDVAIKALEYLKQKGISVPETLAVTGANDTLTPEDYPDLPSLTTLHTPLEQMGNTARELILDALRLRTTQATTISFRPELVIRESSQPSRLA
ncbi:MAG: GntR family transcriptional regulator [Phycisphaerae bacterium]|nr:GntR family transcriptional regulator [Phycisphaerae bacterium]